MNTDEEAGAMTSSLMTVTPLSPSVGAEVSGIDAAQLSADHELAASIRQALERHGVLLFRGLGLTPEQQVAFAQKLGEIDFSSADDPIAGVMKVTLDPAARSSYFKGTFFWHIDGCTPDADECPQMATILSAQAVSAVGGETEFASTYAAYEDLSAEDKERLAGLRVVHSLEASQRLAFPDAGDNVVARWRARKTSEHPLIWTHRDGRRSLVLGASTDHVVGLDVEEGRALLEDLLDRSTTPDRVYRHSWTVGDTVIWDNRGVLHRAEPYDETSQRLMFRTTVLGDEPIE